jgi:mono/diheme cytochrome c family protein
MRLTNFIFGSVALLVTGAYCASVAGQASVQNTKIASIYEELAKAPEKYRAKQNPLSHDPEAVKAGSILFEEHCEECHGVGAIGGKKAPNLRVEQVQQASDGAIFWILSNGIVRKRMPVWSKLPEPQRWQLVSYIKSLGSGTPEKSSRDQAPTPTQDLNPAMPQSKPESRR